MNGLDALTTIKVIGAGDAADVDAWARRIAASLEPMTSTEAAAVGLLAADLDARQRKADAVAQRDSGGPVTAIGGTDMLRRHQAMDEVRCALMAPQRALTASGGR